MDASNEYTSTDEYKMREADAMDRLRTETALQLRKYYRRVKNDAEPEIRRKIAEHPRADVDEIVKEVFGRVGLFLNPEKKAIDGTASATRNRDA